MKPQAKKLILNLLLAAHVPVGAREVVRACALFAISETSARVALTRLSAEGMIESAGRGAYRLGPEAATLAEDVSHWRDKEQRLRRWNGAYLTVCATHLGRRDRTALKRRERALQLLGFEPLEVGLYVRPDNIERDVDAVRAHLHTLGLEADAIVMTASGFPPAREQQIAGLWDCDALNRIYRDETAKMEAWMARSDALEPDVALRESFLLGNQAIRHVVFDPLLPEPFVDAAARSRFFATTRRMDDHGKSYWRTLIDLDGG